MTRNQAVKEARECADSIIEQRTRQAKGWDRGEYRDDMRDVDRIWHLPIEAAMHCTARRAFELSKQFANG